MRLLTTHPKTLSIAIAALLSLSACGSESAPAADNSSSTAPASQQQSTASSSGAFPEASVGVIMNNLEEKNDFLKTTYHGFRQAASQNPQVKMTIDTTAGDQAAQEAMARSMLAQGAKSLVINPIDPTHPSLPAMVDKFCAENIPVVYFNRNPGEKNLAQCGEKAYLIMGDDTEAGVQQGLAILEQWKQNPSWDKNGDGTIQYAIVQAAEGVLLTKERTEWVTKTISSYPDLGKPIQMIFSGHANFSAPLAEAEVTKWLDDPRFAEVEVIIANTDDLALGALAALQKRSMTLPIFGADGIRPALEAVKRGDLAGTSMGAYDAQAGEALRIAANLAAGRPALEGIPQNYNVLRQTIRTPFFPVSQANVDQYLK